MAINAKMVAELRERTGAAMMDCKRALESTDGDMELAIDHLRKSGLKSAEKRAGRSTAEGRVLAHLADDGHVGAMVALTSETDFVARTGDFGDLLRRLARHVAEHEAASPEALLEQRLEGGSDTVGEVLKQLSGKLGENMQVPKIARFENRAGRVGAYVHHNDKIGALLSVTAPAASPEDVAAFVKSLGMHVAANRPLALRRDDVPTELAERERQVYAQSEEVLKKPEDKRERIVGGMMEKFFSGAALLEQPWVLDPDTSVEKALQKALGKDARVEAFALFVVGG